jgi:hypothetical protein
LPDISKENNSVGESNFCFIFTFKWDETHGKWRKLPKEELHDLYSVNTIISVLESNRVLLGL